MRICPKCGFEDDPIWKPYFFHLYWEYAPLESFKETIPIFHGKTYCEAGNFWYHFEDRFYYYYVGGKTRKIIKRFPKGRESMVNRKLFEKTPSEKGMPDLFQRKLLEEKVKTETQKT